MTAEIEAAGEGWLDWTDVQLDRLGCNLRASGCFGAAAGLIVGVGYSVVSPYFLSLAAFFAYVAKCERDYSKELIDFENPKEVREVRAKVLKTPLDQIIYDFDRYFDLRIMSQVDWRKKFCQDTKEFSFEALYEKYQWSDISGLFPEDERERFDKVWQKATPIIEAYKKRKADIKKNFEQLREAVIEKHTHLEPRYHYRNGRWETYWVRVTDWVAARPEIHRLDEREWTALVYLWSDFKPQYQNIEALYHLFLQSIPDNQSKV